MTNARLTVQIIMMHRLSDTMELKTAGDIDGDLHQQE